jgi:NTP pyrophosphatase (non-canonical NTP hydrolase)
VDRVAVNKGEFMSEYEVIAVSTAEMTFEEYTKRALSTAQFDPSLGLIYPALGIAGESGEFVDKIKKEVRNNGNRFGNSMSPEVRLEMVKELGDILWYINQAADQLGYNLQEVAAINIRKLEDRRKRNAIKSEGDNR